VCVCMCVCVQVHICIYRPNIRIYVCARRTHAAHRDHVRGRRRAVAPDLLSSPFLFFHKYPNACCSSPRACTSARLSPTQKPLFYQTTPEGQIAHSPGRIVLSLASRERSPGGQPSQAINSERSDLQAGAGTHAGERR
jgi:hypothetical protein